MRVASIEDFCGAANCNIIYVLALLTASSPFEFQVSRLLFKCARGFWAANAAVAIAYLQSAMLLDGSMTRRARQKFDETTVLRLNSDAYEAERVLLSVALHDVPHDLKGECRHLLARATRDIF